MLDGDIEADEMIAAGDADQDIGDETIDQGDVRARGPKLTQSEG